MEQYWVIQEWISATQAFGQNGYWGERRAGRYKGGAQASAEFERLKNLGRRVRLLHVSCRVVEQCP